MMFPRRHRTTIEQLSLACLFVSFEAPKSSILGEAETSAHLEIKKSSQKALDLINRELLSVSISLVLD